MRGFVCPEILGYRRERMNLEASQAVEQFTRDWERSARDRTWTANGARSSMTTAWDVQAALDDHAIDDTLVVFAGHGGATTDLLRSLLRDEGLEDRAPGLVEHGVPGGALTILVRHSNRWLVSVIADEDHIPVPDRTGHAARLIDGLQQARELHLASRPSESVQDGQSRVRVGLAEMR